MFCLIMRVLIKKCDVLISIITLYLPPLSLKIKVCHLSSVHYAMDTRIFYKMCQALKENYEVALIANHPKEEFVNGVKIVPFQPFKKRNIRVLLSWLLMFFKAIKQRASIYHFHDPELIPCGILLSMFGKKVIYDVHENIAEDIFDKPWIRNQKMAYRIFNFFEKRAVKRFHLILAEKSYQKRYELLNANFSVVLNYCDIEFFKKFEKKDFKQQLNLFYIGIVLENRGILEIIESVKQLKEKGMHVNFHVVGELYSDLSAKIKHLDYYDDIKGQLHFYGRKRLEEGYALAEKMDIGMCIIWPMKNSMESYPTKLFEYMAVGLPIITSSFPLYKEVVEGNGCGLCVSPRDSKKITEAIETIHRDVLKTEQMSENGKLAVKKHYDWESQKRVLVRVYKDIEEKIK